MRPWDEDPTPIWERIITEGRQVIINGTSQGSRTVSPVAILSGRGGRKLVHVHIDDDDFDGKHRMRSYPMYGIWVTEEMDPQTASDYAKKWSFSVGSFPCPGQKVVFRR